MAYFDSAYIAKFYLRENGHAEVRQLARNAGSITSSWLAYAEVMAVFHRYLREGAFDRPAASAFSRQFDHDVNTGLWTLIPVSREILISVGEIYRALAHDVWLRSADAIHLATAKAQGFRIVHSNDRHLLKAAPKIGMKGVNVVPDRAQS